MGQPSSVVESPVHEAKTSMSSLVVAFSSFLMWGLLPIYWKQLGHVSSLELMCHRMVWSALFTGVILTLTRRWSEVRAVLASRASLLWLMLTSALLAVNWWTFIWAVNNNYVLESSLGYYINPLVNVVLGYVFLRDSLRRFQVVAVLFAVAGVLNMVVNYGRFPWIALVLAITFGFYGLVRKVIRPGPLPGLFAETCMASLLAGPYILWLGSQGAGGLGNHGAYTDLLILLTGAATSIPLLCFAFGARRLRLVTLGVLQYTAPTCFFFLATFVYGEPFTWVHGVTFALIWTGIGIFTLEGVRHSRRNKATASSSGQDQK